MELFRFSLKKFLSSDGILVYLLMALGCGISRLDATNLLNFCYIQKFSKPFLFTSHRNILNPKLEWGYTRLGYWRIADSWVTHSSMTNERLRVAGYPTLYDEYLKWYPK